MGRRPGLVDGHLLRSAAVLRRAVAAGGFAVVDPEDGVLIRIERDRTAVALDSNEVLHRILDSHNRDYGTKSRGCVQERLGRPPEKSSAVYGVDRRQHSSSEAKACKTSVGIFPQRSITPRRLVIGSRPKGECR